MTDFAGRTAVVTGGGRGIGLACARLMAARGAFVALIGEDDATLRAAERSTRSDGLAVTAVVADLAIEAQVESAIGECARVLGSIDILVNNAAIQPYGTVLSMEAEEWDRVIGINLRGAYLGLDGVRTAERCM